MKNMDENAKKLLPEKRKLRPYRKYSQEMKSLRYLRSLSLKRRETLLRSLYDLAKQRMWFENWATREREGASQLRAWKKYFKASRTKLANALRELAKLARQREVPYGIEALFEPEAFSQSGAFRSEIVEAAKKLAHCHERAEQLESLLTALIHPKLRGRTEKLAGEEEFTPHYLFSPQSKSRNIDHWVMARAAAILSTFEDDAGKKIPRCDRVISNYFYAAFGYSITDENVRTTLRRRMSSDALRTDPPRVDSLLGREMEKILEKKRRMSGQSS